MKSTSIKYLAVVGVLLVAVFFVFALPLTEGETSLSASSSTVGERIATLHLELAKDTLALAEPFYLTATITNKMDKDLLVDNCRMFRLKRESYPFCLFLITPSGKEWLYTGGRTGHVTVVDAPHLWLWISPGISASKGERFFWTPFLPPKYQVALEKLPPGTYKLFATYQLPEQEGLHETVIYSDTVEFVFLPLKKERRQALIEMDSLRDFYMGGGARFEVAPILKRIMVSKTPYSEGAHSLYITMIPSSLVGVDSLIMEKARFDELYPESQFAPVLLREQANVVKTASERDSLNRILAEMEPTNTGVLLRQGIVRHPVTLEEMR